MANNPLPNVKVDNTVNKYVEKYFLVIDNLTAKKINKEVVIWLSPPPAHVDTSKYWGWKFKSITGRKKNIFNFSFLNSR